MDHDIFCGSFKMSLNGRLSLCGKGVKERSSNEWGMLDAIDESDKLGIGILSVAIFFCFARERK